MKSGHVAPSFAAAHTVGARFWRVLIDVRQPAAAGAEQIAVVRRAGFEPVVTVGGAFAGGAPSVKMLRALAPLATYFTVYNEPDYDRLPIDTYRTLFTASRTALQGANPAARVLLCDCTAQAATYVRSIRKRGAIANDGLAWHPYTRRFARPSTAAREIAAVQREARELGVTRLWATEFGFPPSRPGSYWGTMVKRLQRAGVTAAFAYHVRGTASAAWDTALLNPDGSPRAAQMASLRALR